MGLGPQKLKMLMLEGTVLCLTLLKLFSKQRNFVTHCCVAKNGQADLEKLWSICYSEGTVRAVVDVVVRSQTVSKNVGLKDTMGGREKSRRRTRVLGWKSPWIFETVERVRLGDLCRMRAREILLFRSCLAMI
jgi:hypothetical protein